MALSKAFTYGESESILDSEVGIVTKTRTATQAMAKDADGRKIIKAGALYTGTSEFGVFLEDYDMTDTDKCPAAIIFQGRLKADKVSAEANAKKTDLAAAGLYLV
jgi:hypothetical protein